MDNYEKVEALAGLLLQMIFVTSVEAWSLHQRLWPRLKNTRLEGDKDKRRDLNPNKTGRRETTDYVVKKALGV